MLSICSAAAVAKKDDFMILFECSNDGLGDLSDAGDAAMEIF
jgi:hypothetical protein